jgi:hypothetical protein
MHAAVIASEWGCSRTHATPPPTPRCVPMHSAAAAHTTGSRATRARGQPWRDARGVAARTTHQHTAQARQPGSAQRAARAHDGARLGGAQGHRAVPARRALGWLRAARVTDAKALALLSLQVRGVVVGARVCHGGGAHSSCRLDRCDRGGGSCRVAPSSPPCTTTWASQQAASCRRRAPLRRWLVRAGSRSRPSRRRGRGGRASQRCDCPAPTRLLVVQASAAGTCCGASGQLATCMSIWVVRHPPWVCLQT